MKYPNWKIPAAPPAPPPALLEAGYAPLLAAVLHCRGLDTPEATVRIAYTTESGGDGELVLTVGERLPDRSGRYTRMEGDTTIYLLETDLLDPLMRVAANGLDG